MNDIILMHLSIVSSEIPHGRVYDCSPSSCSEGAGGEVSVGAGHFMP